SSCDTIGPLTHTVEDAALLLEVLAGYDEKDNTSSSRPVPNYRQFAQNPDANRRIGVPEGSLGNGLDYEIRESLEERLSGLEQQGAELYRLNYPILSTALKPIMRWLQRRLPAIWPAMMAYVMDIVLILKGLNRS